MTLVTGYPALTSSYMVWLSGTHSVQSSMVSGVLQADWASERCGPKLASAMAAAKARTADLGTTPILIPQLPALIRAFPPAPTSPPGGPGRASTGIRLTQFDLKGNPRPTALAQGTSVMSRHRRRSASALLPLALRHRPSLAHRAHAGDLR